jgi:putative membrane protein
VNDAAETNPFKSWIGIFLRGCAMGAADLVPGVSGGTIAFISGIYERLIEAIANLDIAAIRLVFKGDIKGAWWHFDGNFLLALAVGILTAIFSLAHLIEYLVENQPILVWSFFSGLILASIIFMLRRAWPSSVAAISFVVVGAGLAFALAQFRGAGIPVTPLFIFMGGFIAISAMLLPGVSGSFLLLMLGLYQSTLAAVTDFDLAYIAVFGLGAASGFVVFSRVIRTLLHRFHDQTILFLTGLLVGSLYTTWPWKLMRSDGLPENVWPSEIVNLGGNTQLVPALLCLAIGFALVLAVTFAGMKAGDKKDAAAG